MKKKIVAVINDLSGNANKADEELFLEKLSLSYDVSRVYFIRCKTDEFDLTGFSAVAVYGGDGTLNSVLRKLPDYDIEILYRPSGTLNELGKTMKNKCGKKPMLTETGIFSGKRFAYVAAAGTFTSIGAKTSSLVKKRIKLLAYFSDVLRNYKIQRIKLKLSTDRGEYDGEYTLVMFLDSNRCFGFRFNKLYKPNDEKIHLLMIKSPKGNGIFSKIKIFFPLFRVFFLGVNKEIYGKNITFVGIKKANGCLAEEESFCFDGECQSVSGEFSLEVKPLTSPIKLFLLDD